MTKAQRLFLVSATLVARAHCASLFDFTEIEISANDFMTTTYTSEFGSVTESFDDWYNFGDSQFEDVIQQQTTIDLIDNEYFYSINLTMGSPPQQFQALVDTGSSDTWVSATNNSACGELCDTYGSFDANTSCTYMQTTHNFKSGFAGGTEISGVLANDIMGVNNGEMIIPSMTFGYVTNAQDMTINAVVGLGLPALESVHGYTGALDKEYPTFLQQLQYMGYIDEKIFSFDMKNKKLEFGYFNENLKYETFPLVDTSSSKYYINMTSLEVDGSRNIMNGTEKVLLDSGTNFLQFEESVAMDIAQSFNATWYADETVFLLPNCTLDSYRNTGIALNFGSNMPIDISLDTFTTMEGGECALDMLFYTEAEAEENSAATIVLGTPFFQSAYIVFDTDNKHIKLSNYSTN